MQTIKRFELPLAVFVCILLACFGSTLSFADKPAEYPQVVFDSTSKDFGTLRQGEKVEASYTISNEGTAPLRIEKIEFSMPGMNLSVPQTIAAGATAELQITLDTSKLVKDVEAKALLQLNDPQHPKIMLVISGTVVAPIEFLPMPAIYMSQFNGEAKSRSISIRNNQDSTLHVVKLEPMGEHFVAKIEEQEPGKLFRLEVTVPASTPVGRYQEALLVHTDDPVRKRLHIEVNILVKPDIFLAPENVDFGRIDLRLMAKDPSLLDLVRQTVVINRREGQMTIQSATSDIPFLTISTEPAGASQSFRLETGLDQDKLKPGTFTGNLVLKTDDPELPQLTIPVRIEITGPL